MHVIDQCDWPLAINDQGIRTFRRGNTRLPKRCLDVHANDYVATAGTMQVIDLIKSLACGSHAVDDVTRQPERHQLRRVEEPALLKGDAQVDVHDLRIALVDQQVCRVPALNTGLIQSLV